MKVITAASVHDALASLVPQLASVLPDDILAGLIVRRAKLKRATVRA